MPPPTARPAFFTRHGRVPLYVPNLIGERVCGRIKKGETRACVCRTEDGDGGRFFSFNPDPLFFNGSTPPASSPPPPTGYLRVACAAYAFSVALTNPVACIVFYFIG